MSTDPKAELLSKVPLFRSCSPSEIEYLVRVTEEVAVAADAVLAKEGDVGREFFIIAQGRATVLWSDGTADLGPGDFFGEMALLDQAPRSATVQAATDMELLVLGVREFNAALTEIPSLARNVMTVLAQRLRDLEQGPHH